MADKEVGSLIVKIVGDNEDYKKSMEEVIASSDEAGLHVSDFLKFLTGPAGLVAAAGAVLVAAGEMGAQFDEMSSSMERMTGANPQGLKDLNDSLTDMMANGSDAKMADIATALGEVEIHFGQTGQAAEVSAQLLLDFSKVTGQQVGPAIEDTSRLMQKWNVDASNMAGVLDMLTRAHQLTGVSVSQLSQELTTSGAQLQAVGLDLTQSIALLASFEAGGVRTQNVVMGINTALARFHDSGQDARQAFATVIEQIKNAQDPTDALNLSLEVFGRRAGVEMSSAIRSGKVDLDAMVAKLQDAGGTVRETAEASKTLGESFQASMNAMGVALKPLGELLIGIAKVVVEVLTGLVQGLTSFFTKAFDGLYNYVVKPAMDLLMPMINQIDKSMGGSGGDVVGIPAGVQARMDAYKKAHSGAMPITQAGAGTLGNEMDAGSSKAEASLDRLVQVNSAAQADILDKLKTTTAQREKSAQDAQKVAEETADYEMEWQNKASDNAVEKLNLDEQRDEEEAKKKIANTTELAATLQNIQQSYADKRLALMQKMYAEEEKEDDQSEKEAEANFKQLIDSATQDLTSAGQMVTVIAANADTDTKASLDNFAKNLDLVSNAASEFQKGNVLGGIVDLMELLQNKFPHVFDAFADAVNNVINFLNMMMDNVGTFFTNVFGTLEQTFQSTFGALENALNDMVQAVENAVNAIGNAASGAGNWIWNNLLGQGGHGFMGMFAEGTDFAPGGLAIVGENGPELVNLPMGAQVFPNSQTNQMLAQGLGGGTVNNFSFVVNSPLELNPNDLSRQVLQAYNQMAFASAS